jgi:hypothetical protein
MKMKSLKAKFSAAALILILALPALSTAAVTAEKKAKSKAVQKTIIPAQETPALAAGLDERWTKENQELLGLIQEKKLGEAQQKAMDTVGYLTEMKLLGGQEAATTFNNLGMVQISMGQFDKGVTNIVQALELKRKIHGDSSLEVATIWQNLAELYRVQAQVIQAKKIE